MRKLRLAMMALAIIIAGGMTATTGAQADLAASQSKIPNIQSLVGSGVESVAYRISTKYYNGCYRYYYCKYRKWICGPYGYNCHWDYSGCYYGSCRGGYGGGGGGGY